MHVLRSGEIPHLPAAHRLPDHLLAYLCTRCLAQCPPECCRRVNTTAHSPAPPMISGLAHQLCQKQHLQESNDTIRLFLRRCSCTSVHGCPQCNNILISGQALLSQKQLGSATPLIAANFRVTRAKKKQARCNATRQEAGNLHATKGIHLFQLKYIICCAKQQLGKHAAVHE